MDQIKKWHREHTEASAWGIFGFTTLMSVWAWSKLGTDVTNLYRLFPLFGLIAFGTMWGHYMVWALRVWSGAEASKTALYSKVTQWVVLVSILLHPALIIYKLNADGLGTPPESYKAYVGEALVGFVFLGMICLIAFIAFEFKKYLQSRGAIWKAVLIANHLAMLGIVIHALKLGNSVKQAPLKYLWPIYGLSLLGVYVYLASKKKLI